MKYVAELQINKFRINIIIFFLFDTFQITTDIFFLNFWKQILFAALKSLKCNSSRQIATEN